MDAGEIGGGAISWTPPVDTSSIEGYQVFIAYDSLGTHQAQLWWSNPQTEQFSFDFPVGTNSFTLFEPTHRRTDNSAYPANWLLVYSHSNGVLQATADAAKVPLYDASASVPNAVDLVIDTSATYMTLIFTVAGTVQWSPADFADLGLVEQYSLYISTSAGDTSNEVSITDVPVGTNQYVLPGFKQCAHGAYLAVYGRNANGRAASASWQALQACPVTTQTATVTTTTTTTTTALASGTLIFTDTNSEADQIGGAVIQWSPTTDPTTTHYECYIANDDAGSYLAMLWHLDPVTEDVLSRVPVGTNEFHVFNPTARRTTDSAYPANWVFMLERRTDGLQKLEGDGALSTPLYDASTSVPSLVPMSYISVFDIDPTDATVFGSVQWSVSTTADLGRTQEFAIYLARDSAGTGEAYLGTVSIGTNRLMFSTQCWDRNHLLVYASNPNGRATQATSTTLTGCTTADPAGDPTTTTLTTTTEAATTTTLSPTSVTSVQFNDTNMEAGQIGGAIVSWTPPSDTSQVSGYEVYVANDRLASYRANLWFQESSSGDIGKIFPVGTNEFQIYHSTVRATAEASYPANWVVVYSVVAGTQQYSEAATTTLYDASANVPADVALSMTFTDDDAAETTIGGTLQWTAPATADLGLATGYEVYIARGASGSGESLLQSVSVGTNELVLAPGTDCFDKLYLLIYASNPNGRSSQPASLVLDTCSLSAAVTTLTVTTTSPAIAGQTTTTPQGELKKVTGLTFNDTNPVRGQIGGAIVSWIPPLDVTNVARYELYLAFSQEGDYEAQLWWENAGTTEIGRGVPVGTNQITLFSSTERRTMESGYPANWLIVYTHDGSQRQDWEEAATSPVYDDSGDRPFPVFLDWIQFFDLDYSNEKIAGMLHWQPTALSDLGLANEYCVYLAENTMGFGKVELLRAPMGDTQTWVPMGTYCWNYKYLLMYACNPYGEAFFGASYYLDGCTTPPTTSTFTITTTTRTTTTITTVAGQTTRTATTSTASTSTASTSTVTLTTTLDPSLMPALTFNDTNAVAGQIGGAAIQWTPPSDTSAITSYEVYIASDEQGSYQVLLWYEDPSSEQMGSHFPVGTNSFTIFSPTARQTSNPSYPANWVIVYTRSGSTLQSIGDAAKTRLYDASGSAPGSISFFPMFVDMGSWGGTIVGTLQWSLPATADLGYTTHYNIYQATDSAGTQKQALQTVPLGTNQLVIPSATACSNGDHLVVYLANPDGEASSGAAASVFACR